MIPTATGPRLALERALDGRYAIERELDRGGVGIVYLAHEPKLDRKVALKLLPPHLAAQPAHRARFLREARAAARLNHPNIVPIHDVHEAGEFVCFTMAYVEGETLAQRVREDGPLPPSEVSRILREVARAVAYANERGIVHRDLKPHNIMIERGKDARPVLLDFGMARVLRDGDPAERGMIVGTYAFMSPEQARGEPVDARSDVYSLGVVGYYAASGTLPFRGETVQEILEQHLTRPAPPLVVNGVECDDPLARVVRRCLAKRPDDRFQTAAELADVLEVPREIEVAHRTFVRRLRILSWTSLPVAFALIQTIGLGVQGDWGGMARWFGFGALVVGGAAAYLLRATRRLLAEGYGRADVVRALRVDMGRKREEVVYRVGRRRADKRVRRWVPWLGVVPIVLAGWLGAEGVIGSTLALWVAVLGMGWALITGVIGAYRHRRRDPAGRAWLWFWRKSLGERWVWLAGLGLDAGSERRGSPSLHATVSRAAALAVGRLYEDLPESARSEIAALPSVVRGLEEGSHSVRTWLAEMEASMAREADASDAALVESREEALQVLAETVSALERLRHQLLAFQEGIGGVDGISAELEGAREITEAVDRLEAGWAEVRRVVG